LKGSKALGRRDKANQLTPSEAERKIASIIKDGTIELSIHCKRDSMPKRHVTYPDITYLLDTGHIIREGKWDEDYEQWKYIVEGRDLDGDDLSAVTVIFDETFSLLIVTVY